MANANEVLEAIQAGDAEKLRRLLSADPRLGASRDASGVSALMHAIYRRHTACIAVLRQAGLSLDVFEAASLGALDRLASVVVADPTLVSAYSPDGFTALHFAAYFSQPAAARFLLEHGSESAAVAKNPTQVMPLHSAVSSSNSETVRDLLKHAVPVNARQQHGWTALHAAAQNGNLEIVELLLQNGADASIRNDQGVTPLELARKYERSDVIERLACTKTDAASSTQSSAF
jgi:ankyrin repeat protein